MDTFQSSSSINRVNLDPNSLYVGTSQLMANLGTFHWSAYFTNSTGGATKFHWGAINKLEGNGKAEGVTIHKIATVASSTTTGKHTFAYFKVAGFTPPSTEVLADIAERVFDTGSYATVRENRDAGLRCRTWLFAFLKKLQQEGHIVRQDDITRLEDYMVETSIDLEIAMAERGEAISKILTI